MATIGLRALGGVARSIAVYRLDRRHARGLRRLYAHFVADGDLAIDVGAHVGDRIAAFRSLGARVVGVEPQPLLAGTLRVLNAFDRHVVIERVALGAERGQAHLHVNASNPSVSTRSSAFLTDTAAAPGWEGQHWEHTVTVDAETLDGLITRHGDPTFVKIDVEGFEAEVIAGLSKRPPALSFEIVTAYRAGAREALEKARRLGYDHFRLSLGESHVWHGPWCNGDTMAATLDALPDTANSGDVYAVCAGHRALAA